MLYDNALLARAYLHGYQVTGDPVLRRTAEETLDWALREMRGPEGGFYSALDADTEGVEGKFYVWTLDELRAVLDADDADAAIAWFGATERGNFEGANILESRGPEPEPEQRLRIRAALLEARAARVRPGLDDKRLTAWNALMIAALADAGAVLGRDDYLDAARAAAAFVLGELRTPEGRLLRTYNAGEAKLAAYLEDHAFLLEALLVLYEATFEPRWFSEARALADTIVARFADPELGGFFSTADDDAPLLARRKDLEDAPIPSGGASAALGLIRLARLSGEQRLRGARRRAARARRPRRRAPPGRLRAPAAGARPLPRRAAGGGAGRGGRRAGGAGRRGPRRAPAAPRSRRRPRRRAPAARWAHVGRRPRRGVRVRALRVPARRSPTRETSPTCSRVPIQPVLDVCDAGRLHRTELLEPDVCAAEVVEQASAAPEEHGNDVQLELVEQPRRQVLVDDLGAAPEQDVLTARGLLRQLERPADPVGDEVVGRAALHLDRLAR